MFTKIFSAAKKAVTSRDWEEQWYCIKFEIPYDTDLSKVNKDLYKLFGKDLKNLPLCIENDMRICIESNIAFYNKYFLGQEVRGDIYYLRIPEKVAEVVREQAHKAKSIEIRNVSPTDSLMNSIKAHLIWELRGYACKQGASKPCKGHIYKHDEESGEAHEVPCGATDLVLAPHWMSGSSTGAEYSPICDSCGDLRENAVIHKLQMLFNHRCSDISWKDVLKLLKEFSGPQSLEFNKLMVDALHQMNIAPDAEYKSVSSDCWAMACAEEEYEADLIHTRAA